MTYAIRPCQEQDYPALAELLTRVFQRGHKADHLKKKDGPSDPRCKAARWVEELDGSLVGSGNYLQTSGMYHPRKFEVGLAVHPEHRRLGIGAALYRQIQEALAPFNPIALGANIREDWPDAIAFAERRGFVERMRTWESHLDLTTYDSERFADLEEQVGAAGYDVRSYSELADLPDLNERLYALVSEVRRDIPSSEPLTEISFEQWVKELTGPRFIPDYYLVAAKGEEWVGVTALGRSEEEGVLRTGITAVKRVHRGTGIARALKLEGLRRAKAAGHRKVMTWNSSDNQRMLAINMQLGFQRQPAWVAYSLKLKDEE